MALVSPLHPRNRHQGRYDFKKLVVSSPNLIAFVSRTKFGEESIDFASPEAVKALNRALLKHFYGVKFWDIPKNYLCPPIPGRADVIHYLADLFPVKENLRVLDIGVGANCIYPLIGQNAYQWNFVGSDIDEVALKSAQIIIQENKLQNKIELRHQKDDNFIFKNIITEKDKFHLTLCNPPFHSSAEEAAASTERKWKNLGKKAQAKLNFGGQSKELWCEGGELAFILKMIDESVLYQKQCMWFSTLVSKEDNLPRIYAQLKAVGALKTETLNMSQGQKISRLVAWTFLDDFASFS